MYNLAFFINVFLHSTLRAQVFSLPSGQMKAWYKCYIYFWPMATFAVILQLLGMKYVQWLLSREVVSPSVLAQIDTTVVNQILRMIQSNVKNSVPGISMNPI